MSKWPFDESQSGLALRRQFAVFSFALIALITVALSVAMTSALRRDLLDRGGLGLGCQTYAWPGNVRELARLMDRAILLHE